MTFDEFINSRLTNAWVKEPGLDIYVRKNLVWRGLIDFANINAKEQGKGTFTAFLERIDPIFALKVENVLGDRFAEYFRRRGWAELPCDYGIPSFFNINAVKRELGPISKLLLTNTRFVVSPH